MKLSSFVGTLILGLAAAASAAQIPLGYERSAASVAAVAAPEEYQVLKTPSLPAHQLRIKQVAEYLCDPTVRSFSGYMDVDVDKLRQHYQDSSVQSDQVNVAQAAEAIEALAELDAAPRGTIEHFYFWAFESRDKPESDPHVLWLNGGPGCSSFTGLLMELGPCNAADPKKKGFNNSAEFNPYGWNARANMVFLDQPVGVGFSYVSWSDPKRKDPAPGRIYSTSAAARDASAFLHLLTAHAPDIYDTEIKEFHIAGESFAGRYIPLIAAQVLRDNKAWDGTTSPQVPLRSVAIGNGITNPLSSYTAYYTYACTDASPDGPHLDAETCKGMKKALPVCLDLTRKCNKIGTNLACSTAATFCEGGLSSKWDLTNSSIYDYKHSPPEYAEEEWVSHLLNLPSTREALGIDAHWPGVDSSGAFIGCSDAVGSQFDQTGDGARTSVWAAQEILRQGIRVLSYGGKRDFICNVFSLGPPDGWTEVLDWEYGDEFRAQPLIDWTVAPKGGKKHVAGQYKTYANLSFASIEESGHFAPHDKPVESLEMLNRWLHEPADGSF